MKEFLPKLTAALKLAAKAAAVVGVAVMAFLLRKRSRELRQARVESLETKNAAADEKRETAIVDLEAKVEKSEKDALAKTHLLRDLLNGGDGPGLGD